jgi:hypothetical protein
MLEKSFYSSEKKQKKLTFWRDRHNITFHHRHVKVDAGLVKCKLV